tara:strand:+ start:368 stop:547 length:180 start_codon:yes stop_codon:yes gene_type:complete
MKKINSFPILPEGSKVKRDNSGKRDYRTIFELIDKYKRNKEDFSIGREEINMNHKRAVC